jgi:hypothetical protein
MFHIIHGGNLKFRPEPAVDHHVAGLYSFMRSGWFCWNDLPSRHIIQF